MIRFETDDVTLPEFSTGKVSEWLGQVAALHGKRIGEINYLLCSDERMIGYNQMYLNHDYYTDIITFDYTEDNLLMGDIYLAPETIASNADLFQTSFHRELLRVFVHGLLHLCGFPDGTPEEKERMHEKEEEALQRYI